MGRGGWRGLALLLLFAPLAQGQNCGNGIVEPGEQCDTGSQSSGGCLNCRVALNYFCSGAPSVCSLSYPLDTAGTASMVLNMRPGTSLTAVNAAAQAALLAQSGAVGSLFTITSVNPTSVPNQYTVAFSVALNSVADDISAISSRLTAPSLSQFINNANGIVSIQGPIQWSGARVCGDGRVQLGEQCDTGTFTTGFCLNCIRQGNAVCRSSTIRNPGTLQPVIPARLVCSLCGNGFVDAGEQCDDGNLIETDGCSSSCLSSTAVAPVTAGSCGNGIREGSEACDDGNRIDRDGCAANCAIEPGWSCSLVNGRSICAIGGSVCGNGIREPNEMCDDANARPGDGCGPACLREPGFECTTASPSVCRRTSPAIVTPGCGSTGVFAPGLGCNDGNLVSGDGCSSSCLVEPGFDCKNVVGVISICSRSIDDDNNFGIDLDDDDSSWWPVWILAGLCLCSSLLALLFFLVRRKPREDPYIPPPAPIVPVAAPVVVPEKVPPMIVHEAPPESPSVVYEVYDTYDEYY